MTTSNVTLGRLEEVNLRQVWPNEEKDFTPWLARDNNIELLSSVIGIDLEVEALERRVGEQYRADIVCRGTDPQQNQQKVLIENQLEPTDQSHLGQLITYAASLDAVTIVWISGKFSDSHRKAMDWLNNNTPDEFRFFGLEIEVWSIGGSGLAPRFNIVSKPPDWTYRNRFIPNNSHTSQHQLKYWRAFREVLEDSDGALRLTAPGPESWQAFSICHTNFDLRSVISLRDRWIAVQLVFLGDTAKQNLKRLYEEKVQIEREAGACLDWRGLSDSKESRISLEAKFDPNDQAGWKTQHEWLSRKLSVIYRVFAHRIRSVEAKPIFELKKLEMVNIGEVWPSEVRHFTPWLGENLEELSGALGIELELVEPKTSIGSRPDILAYEVPTYRHVVIVSQYGMADLDHRDRLVPRATEFDAQTVVWIAETIGDEHREYLDCLNRRTGTKTEFFGVEVEVLRIDRSLPALRLNVVTAPDEWNNDEEKREKARQQTMNKKFLESLSGHLEERSFSKRKGETNDRSSYRIIEYPIKNKKIRYAAIWHSYEPHDSRPGVEVLIHDDADWNSQVFGNLENDKVEIVDELNKATNECIIWARPHSENRNNRSIKNARVAIYIEGDVYNDKDSWDDYHEWMIRKIYLFRTVFTPRLKELIG